MNAELITTFRFDAAHSLPNVPPGHKCAARHGHSYRVDIHVSGPVDEHAGWVMDFAQVKALVRPLVEQLDHRELNEVSGLSNSTSEMLARWLWERLRPDLPLLSAVTVWESESNRCVYRGD